MSYAHYVVCLPHTSPHLSQAIPRLKSLLSGLLSLGGTTDADSSPSSSTGQYRDPSGVGTAPQSHLCEMLLKAFLWISWSNPELREEVGTVINDLFHKLAVMMKDSSSLSTSSKFDARR